MTTKEIKVGDIVKVADLEDYREAGDEITELVEMFAGQYGKVVSIDTDEDECDEQIYVVSFKEGMVGLRDHEIAELYSKVEL